MLTLLDILSLGNVILIYVSDKWEENIQRAIASVYVAHVLLLILVGGMKNFVSKKSNLFDLVVSTMQFVTALSVTNQEYENHDRFVSVILLLRLLRGFRILFRIERYKVVFDAFMLLLVDAGELLGMMLTAIFLLYGAIGVQLFGGLIWEGNPALHNTTFEASGYGPNNFNDYASSLVTLFELLVVNNWMITMDGFVKASGTKWAYVFVSWWLRVVIVLKDAYIVASFRRNDVSS